MLTGEQLLGLAAVITAFGGFVAMVTTSILQVRATNRATGVVKELVIVGTDTAEKVNQVHDLTNNNYHEQGERLAAVQEKLDMLTTERKESDLLALEATRRLLEEARAEINRLNAASIPPSRDPA